MTEKILAIDLGGTSVKSGLFVDGMLAKTDKWFHQFNHGTAADAAKKLIENSKRFHRDDVDAIGISAAGLIASDDTLYRSTVISALRGTNISRLVQQQYSAKAYSIDNDADCGAIAEWNKRREQFLYVVLGSGIGSQYVDTAGNCVYRCRLDPDHQFKEEDNPVVNDIGLRVHIPREEIGELFIDALSMFDMDNLTINQRSKDMLDRLENMISDEQLRRESDKDDQKEHANNIQIGQLGSGVGFARLFDLLASSEPPDSLNGRYGIDYIHLKNYGICAEYLKDYAEKGDLYAVCAFKLLGRFLGYGIAESAKIIHKEQDTKGPLKVALAGPIMNAYSLFSAEVIGMVGRMQANCMIELANDINSNNLVGAYIQARKSLYTKI